MTSFDLGGAPITAETRREPLADGPPAGDLDPWDCDTLAKADSYLRGRTSGRALRLAKFVSGDFVSCLKPDAATWIDSVDPKSNTIIAKVPCSQPEDVEAAILAAKDAFPKWSRTSIKERSMWLLQISNFLRDKRAVFAVWESIDQGKTLERAETEMDRPIANFE